MVAVKKIEYHADHNGNEVRNVVVHPLGSDPGSPTEAQLWYNSATDDGVLKYEDGAGTKTIATTADIAGAGGGDTSSSETSTTDSQIVLYDGTTGKLIKAASTSGILKASSGVIASATAGTDYSTPSGTETLTNKTIDANGTGNSISNLETADLASGVLNTSTSLASASDTQIPSALAVKTYADNVVAANDAMTYQGAIDASTNPNYPAGDAGDTYKISVAGKIGGASGIDVTVGDMIICQSDSTAAGDHATVGSNWNIIQANVDRATTSTLGLAEYATTTEAEARSSTTTAVTPAGLANFSKRHEETIGDGSSTDIAVTHNLGTQYNLYKAWEISTGNEIDITGVATSTSVTTFKFNTAPGTNTIRVVIG